MPKRFIQRMNIHAGNQKAGKREEDYTLQQMMEGFILEQSCRGNSPATMRYYKENIERYIKYLEEQGLETNLSSISRDHLRKYILYLKNKKKWSESEYIKCDRTVSTKSIQTYIRAVRTWVSWMENEGYVQEEITKKFKLPKATQGIIEILNEDEIKLVFEYLNSKKDNRLRDLLLFFVLIECGLRLEEITMLQKANVRFNQNMLKVIGKGSKERYVSFGANLSKLFYRYINQERPRASVKSNDALFLKQDGVPVKQSTVKQLFRRIKKNTGIVRLHPHLCRHTYCTLYLARGGDIFALKQSTGHETFEILNNYVHLASSMMNIRYKRFSILDELNYKV